MDPGGARCTTARTSGRSMPIPKALVATMISVAPSRSARWAFSLDSAPRPAIPELARHGFEIVDKRSGKEVYLDGSWAELFQQRLNGWQKNMPTQEEIEDTLEGYAELAHTPVGLH